MIVAFSGSTAEAVAMVVPVEVSSANELAATEVDKVTDSLTSATLKVRVLLVLLVPSEAVKVLLFVDVFSCCRVDAKVTVPLLLTLKLSLPVPDKV